jgi:Undecaprenyl-phosphate glucose phosphotransferase
MIGVLVLVTDLLTIMSASLLAGALYHGFVLQIPINLESSSFLGIFCFTNFAAILLARGGYRAEALFDARHQLRLITGTWLPVIFLLLMTIFALKVSASFSRVGTLAFFAAGWAGLALSRVILTAVFGRALRNRELAMKTALVIADRSELGRARQLERLEKSGYLALGTIEVDLADVHGKDTFFASLNEAITLSRTYDVDSIFLQVPWTKQREVDVLVNSLRVLSTPIYLLPDDHVSEYLRRQRRPWRREYLVELKRAPLSEREQIAKRLFDIAVSGFLLVLLAPIALIVAVAIKLDSPGTSIFRQMRNGFNGRRFVIYKFRTMTVAEDGAEIKQATKGDARVTRLGRLLRRSNLDELPQLFNVLRGDMSLVGPRPHAVAHNNEYEKLIANYAFRYHMRPGITGFAQIQGLRGETKTVDRMAARVDADLWYINNWSFWLDLKILLRTLLLGVQSTAY